VGEESDSFVPVYSAKRESVRGRSPSKSCRESGPRELEVERGWNVAMAKVEEIEGERRGRERGGFKGDR
jgi:hypothetical protein